MGPGDCRRRRRFDSTRLDYGEAWYVVSFEDDRGAPARQIVERPPGRSLSARPADRGAPARQIVERPPGRSWSARPADRGAPALQIVERPPGRSIDLNCKELKSELEIIFRSR
ncbi:hypothetical protein ACOMHN_001117 [Nucella lapillus]